LPDYVVEEAGDDALSVGDAKPFGVFAAGDRDRGKVSVSFHKLVVNGIKILRDSEQGHTPYEEGITYNADEVFEVLL